MPSDGWSRREYAGARSQFLPEVSGHDYSSSTSGNHLCLWVHCVIYARREDEVGQTGRNYPMNSRRHYSKASIGRTITSSSLTFLGRPNAFECLRTARAPDNRHLFILDHQTYSWPWILCWIIRLIIGFFCSPRNVFCAGERSEKKPMRRMDKGS